MTAKITSIAMRALQLLDEVVKYLKKFRPEDLVFLDPSGYMEKDLQRYVIKTLGASSSVLPVHSLYELADFIYSARERIFLDSGSKSLAAAYQKHCYVLERGKGNIYFRYPTNTHVVLKG